METETLNWLTLNDLLFRVNLLEKENKLSKQSFVLLESDNEMGFEPVRKICQIFFNPKEDIEKCLKKIEHYHSTNEYFLEKQELEKLQLLKMIDFKNALLIKNISF